MNKVELAGRIANDLEIRKTKNNTSILNFSIGINVGRGENEHPIFINLIAWRNTAEFIEKYFHKGDQILIVGSLDVSTYDKNGTTIYNTFVNVEEVFFGAKKQEKQKEKTEERVTHDAIETIDPKKFIIDNEDLPF